jgi:hypothetical protein
MIPNCPVSPSDSRFHRIIKDLRKFRKMPIFALSRRQHGFEPRWGHKIKFSPSVARLIWGRAGRSGLRWPRRERFIPVTRPTILYPDMIFSDKLGSQIACFVDASLSRNHQQPSSSVGLRAVGQPSRPATTPKTAFSLRQCFAAAIAGSFAVQSSDCDFASDGTQKPAHYLSQIEVERLDEMPRCGCLAPSARAVVHPYRHRPTLG